MPAEETAEMPDMYHGDDFDLAGFCVGIVEKSEMMPFTDKIKAGDIILGLPSSGIHSNGLSLARKIIPDTDRSLMNMLLEPTVIYVKNTQNSGVDRQDTVGRPYHRRRA